MTTTMPNYDTWKTKEKLFAIEYRAKGQVVVTLNFDLEGDFTLCAAPHSYDEYHQTIKDDVSARTHDLTNLINQYLVANEARHYGARVAYDELSEMEVVEQAGFWA